MFTQLTHTLTTLIANLSITTGLAGILLAMALESCCIPLPSELVMPLAGVMVARSHLVPGTNPILALVLVALAGALGSLIGSMVAYGIGYSGGRPLLLKYGRYVLISQHDADLADRFFQRWGSATAFFSRLVPVIRTSISLPAGISKLPFVKFCVFTLLGSLPWCLLLASVGYVLGGNLERLGPIFHSLDVVILLAVVVLVALYLWRHIHHDRKAHAALAAAEAGAASVPGQPTPAQRWTLAQPPQQGWNQPQPPTQQSWEQPQQQD